MNKQSIVWTSVIGGLVLLGAICYVFHLQAVATNNQLMENENKDAMKDEGTMMAEPKKNEQVMEKQDDGAMMKASGQYTVYEPSKLALAADGPVVLFFHAGWCPTCKAADTDINSNLSSIPANTTILKVDYDTNPDLKKKYGVTYQHTFVQVDANGTMIKKWSGGNTLASIVSQLN